MRTLHLLSLLLLASTLTLFGCPPVDDDDAGTDDDDSGQLDDDDVQPDDDDSALPDDDDSAGDDDDVQPDDDDLQPDDDDSAVPDDDDVQPDDDDSAVLDDDDVQPDDDDSAAACTAADLQLTLEAQDNFGNTGTTWTTADSLVMVGIVSNPCDSDVVFVTPNACLLDPWSIASSMSGMARGCDAVVTSWTVASGGQLVDAEPVGQLSADTWTFEAGIPGQVQSLSFLVQ